MSDLKGKVLFNSVYTTTNKKESKIVSLDGGEGFHILPYQEVVIVGKNVEEIKVGDNVLIDIDKFQNKVPGVEINGKMYLALTERDVLYVYGKGELNDENIPS